MSRRFRKPLDKSRGAKPHGRAAGSRAAKSGASGDRKGARAERNFSQNDHVQSDRAYSDRGHGDRAHGDRPQGERKPDLRGDARPQRFAAKRPEKPVSPAAKPSGEATEAPLPTKVQTVTVTADENGMRVDRFLEARFPGLSFSHIQRIVRKGELRVNGKRADSKDRLEEGQTVRIPPLRLDPQEQRPRSAKADGDTLEFLRSIDYPFPEWAEAYMSRVEDALGEAYSEPAADVRGFVASVKG